MISILALVVGWLGMLGLWALAWQLWSQALAIPPIPNSRYPSIGSARWRNEPTPDRFPPEDATEIEEAPVARAHLGSNANTAFFSRTDIATIVESRVEKTEILHEDDILEEPTLCKEKPATADTVPSAPTRKTKFFPGPPPPGTR